ncbi:hypothetical protein [Actinomadura geliboluensis]|uniref:hypothetical protein n=1 Tax=Actinomadura geliboluensis TaxID=882440 RepID=UPI003718B581
MIRATVTYGQERHQATETEPVTFGRDPGCTIRLDPDDHGISRRSGTVRWDGAIWWLVNDSGTRPLVVTDPHIARNLLPRRRRHPLDIVTRVIVDGRLGSHVLIVTPHEQPAADASDPGTEPFGLSTVSGLDVKLTEKDLRAVAALFEEFMRTSRIENIRTYRDAARRIGRHHTEAQVRRRVENLRRRLRAAGIPQVAGDRGLQHLAEFLVHTGQLTFADVRRLLPRDRE